MFEAAHDVDPRLLSALHAAQELDADALHDGEHLEALLADLAPDVPAALRESCVLVVRTRAVDLLHANAGYSTPKVAAWLRAQFPRLGQDQAEIAISTVAAARSGDRNVSDAGTMGSGVDDQVVNDRSWMDQPTQAPELGTGQLGRDALLPGRDDAAGRPGMDVYRRWAIAVAGVGALVLAVALALKWLSFSDSNGADSRYVRPLRFGSPFDVAFAVVIGGLGIATTVALARVLLHRSRARWWPLVLATSEVLAIISGTALTMVVLNAHDKKFDLTVGCYLGLGGAVALLAAALVAQSAGREQSHRNLSPSPVAVPNGAQLVTVPDIAVGTPVAEASHKLTEVRLVPAVVAVGGDHPVSVLTLKPGAGETLHAGSTVTIYALSG
jgi:hypothetical protein